MKKVKGRLYRLALRVMFVSPLLVAALPGVNCQVYY